MSISEPSKFSTPWAESGLKNPIPANSDPVTGRAGFDQGFPAINMTPKDSGGIPPFGQDFNGIFFDITSAIRYNQAGGRPTFSAELAASIGGYPKGAIVMGDDGVAAFQNAADSNMADPNTGGAGWSRIDPAWLTQLSGTLTPPAGWPDVPMHSDPTLGGADGPLNAQAAALAARSELLRIEKQSTVSDYASLRAYAGTANSIYVTGVVGTAKPAGVSGYFAYDATDTTSVDNGGTIIVDALGRRWKRRFTGGLIPDWFGAVPDLFLADGRTLNPSPTDSTVALQKAINATNGHGTIQLTGAYLATATLNNGGILTILGDDTYGRGFQVTGMTNKKFQLGIKSTAAHMFNHTYPRAAFRLYGAFFRGNGVLNANSITSTGTNNMFNVEGKVWETDYYELIMHGCIVDLFGDMAIDGSLGSWNWEITNNSIHSINGLAMYMKDPNMSRVDYNSFGYNNKADLKVMQGTAFSHRHNQHDFHSDVKEYCCWFKLSNNFVSELNYLEQSGGTGGSNGGKNTFPYILEIDHFEGQKMRAIRNNFCQMGSTGGGLARFITIRKSDNQDYASVGYVDIKGNGLAPVPPYFIYYEPPVGSVQALSLNGVSSLNNLSTLVSGTTGKIYDGGGLLLLKGEGLESHYITELTSPVNNTIISPSNCTTPISNAFNYSVLNNHWLLPLTLGGEICIVFQWTSAVAANFTVNFSMLGNVFATTEVKTCTGTSGGGTFSVSCSKNGNKNMELGITLKGGAGPLCDSFKMQVIVK